MSFRIDFDSEVYFFLRHLSPERKRKIKESLRSLAENPVLGKPLQDNLKGFFSYRIGRLRIIYSIDTAKKQIHVVAIGPRRNIYQELEKDLIFKKK